jgi:hypothetical protein
MVEGAPKSSAGHRTLTMPQPLMDMLAAHLRSRGLTAQATIDADRAAADRLADLLPDPSEKLARDKRGMVGA